MDNNKTIIDSEAYQLVTNVFNKIKNATTIEELKGIEVVNRMDTGIYPKINFSIEEDEINRLIADGLIDHTHITFQKI